MHAYFAGDFDCSNTGAGTHGNQCDGVSPFPNVDTKTLDVFSAVQGESAFGGADDLFKGDDKTDAQDDATLETEEGTSGGWHATTTKCAVVVGLLVGLASLMS